MTNRIGEYASAATLFVVGPLLYQTVCPLDAMASELSPWNKPLISGTTAWLILGYLFCAVLALFIVLRIFAIAPRDDEPMFDDPDKPLKADDFKNYRRD